MKKIILTWAVILSVGLTSAFATADGGIDKGTIASFKKEFTTASNVSWNTESVYAKATFTINDQVMFAYYSRENNELIALARNLSSRQLPLHLLTSLKKECDGYWISNIFEVAKPDHTSYFATLENSDETIILEAVGATEWHLYKKTKKSQD